ncbi:hypothetical protein [Candidatus Methanomethylophilus sp. 1R26]|uniref:hypothetical protein n=1 Tax=Candidatus Methanomethylophilus sp. 1R26 TaxID=1769296 RepID=UPI0012FE8D30|nr:hypothetical protein [Candidatus Methanomethylophilus sp. 1R26]
MDGDDAIEVKHVSKTFGTHRSMSLKDRVIYYKQKKQRPARSFTISHSMSGRERHWV